MSGNVWEWCLDSFHISYSFHPDFDPFVTGVGTFRVARGGGWNSDSSRCRSAHRSGFNALSFGNAVGFRVVLARVLVP